jgi:outer membrane protein assembly factor BamB
MGPRALAGLAALLALGAVPGGASASGLPPLALRFHSRPGLHPPGVTVTGNPDHQSGDILLTPRYSNTRRVSIQRGPEIFNAAGQLVWFHPVSHGTATNLQVQSYQGRPVLTWWQSGSGGSGLSRDVIMSTSYKQVALLHAGPGIWTDAHEFQITPQGTALLNGLTTREADLTAAHGPAQGKVQDDVIQEVDIKTGRVLWSWHSVNHIPIRYTYVRPQGSRTFDYFHLNSIQQLPDGNLIVSARDTSAIYEISKATGRVIWELGGKHSSFRMGPGARFSWQHDARLAGDTVTLFDDASDGPAQDESESSAKVLRLDVARMTATLKRRYTHSPALLATSQGNVQRLPDGNVFIGWGSEPEFSEYNPSGRQIFNGTFALGVCSYRAFRYRWTGQPSSPPAMAISPSSGGQVTIYASWNGATRVAAWRVLGGSSPQSLAGVAQATKTGFETTIHVTSSVNYFAVQALDAHGDVLGTSAAKPR